MSNPPRLKVLVDDKVDAAIAKPDQTPMPLRLLGTWRSNRERTVENMPARRPEITPENRARLEEMFGKMVVRYTETHIHTELDGVSSEYAYDVVACDESSIVIRFHPDAQVLQLAEDARRGADPELLAMLESDCQPTLRQLMFDGDSYLLLTSFGFAECFTRVSPADKL